MVCAVSALVYYGLKVSCGETSLTTLDEHREPKLGFIQHYTPTVKYQKGIFSCLLLQVNPNIFFGVFILFSIKCFCLAMCAVLPWLEQGEK